MRRFIWVLVLAACGPRPIPPPPPPIQSNIAECPVSVDLHPEMSCNGWFTSEGFNCVQCGQQAAGCFMKDVAAYCITGDSCSSDPRCSEE